MGEPDLKNIRLNITSADLCQVKWHLASKMCIFLWVSG